MSSKNPLARLRTGIPHFDALLSGGVPLGSVIVVGGPPGSGKSILTQQICYTNASAEQPVLYFNTLSEPTAKSLLHLSQFDFFDRQKLDDKLLHYVDIGALLRKDGLESVSKSIMEHVKEIKPGIVVIDSFKAFNDFAQDQIELRKFSYDLAVNLMAWQTTTFLLGEFGQPDLESNPLFSIIDGLVVMSQRLESGEQQRFLQIVKMRGTDHNRNEFSFEITQSGVGIFAPHLTAQREATAEIAPIERMATGISGLDELLGDGIPVGSSSLVSGVAGTGKTVLLLEFIYRGALAGERGVLFSFEETEERLRAAAAGLGWDFAPLMESGMIEIVFIPQPEISVEKHLVMVQEKIETMQARRVAVDSVSVFLHKITDIERARQKIFQIASVVQSSRAVGLLATDIRYGSSQLSRFGVEETVVDGVILLSATEEGFERQRYIEVYKLRNTAHLKGRHAMAIHHDGIKISPRYFSSELLNTPPPALNFANRLPTGVRGLDQLVGGGFTENSLTLISGSTGIGKTTVGLQFALEGARQGERALFVALEEAPSQIVEMAESLGLPVQDAIDSGRLNLMYVSRQSVRANQFFSTIVDRVEKTGASRLVIDSLGQILSDSYHPEDQRQVLMGLANRFKTMGLTTLLTLEARSLHSTDWTTEQGLSPVADNLIMLRYMRTGEAFQPFVTVVKTRGSAHDKSAFKFIIEKGGARVGDQLS